MTSTTKKVNTRSTSETKSMSQLPYKALKDLSDRLDLLKDGKTAYWRELAREMDYNSVTVENFGLSAGKLNGSPGYSLLLDMSNRGVTYDELIGLLKKLQLYDSLVALGHKEDVRIVKQPVSTPVMVGQTLKLECLAEGVPRPKYLWFKGQTPLMNERSSKLVIENITMDHGGVYLCRAENESNFVFSQWIEVQVQSPISSNKGLVPQGPLNQDTPKVIEHPQPQVLEIGHKLFLTCQAQGSSPLEFQWFRNGEALIYGTAQELVINKVQMADQGVYVCCIKNASGSSVLTKGAQVVVNEPQIIPPSPMPPYVHHPPDIPSIPPLNPGMFPVMSPLPGPAGPHMYVSQPEQIPSGDPLYPGLQLSPNAAGPQYQQSYNNRQQQHTRYDPAEFERGGGSPPQLDCGEPAGEDYINKSRSCTDKVALLIGNKDYHVKTLKLNTPENDTQDLAGILRSADFKVVSLVNLTKKEMVQAVSYFTELIGPNVYALFFFAGHGFELNNMNYMMAVDCTKEKNPRFCVCAQMVQRMMQEKGAKLSIVLLDMCRVAAPQIPITDMSEVYENPYPMISYPGYHIFGFSCSPAEKAYEVAAGGADDVEGQQDRLGLVGKHNSIFVAALKDHLQAERGSLKDTVQTLFNATAKNVHKHKPEGANNQWQRPEISSNLAEDLALGDPIDPMLLPELQEARSRRWKDAHTVPDPSVVSSANGHLVLRLNFEAEHSNVLIVQAEVLQGSLTETKVERMDMQLILQERPVPWILASAMNEFQSSHMAVQKSIAKNNLLHFKIPDLQKITSGEVTLQISATYHWRDNRLDECRWQVQSDQINCRMPPPLYGKITAHEEEMRLRQQQQQIPPPQFPPGHPPFIPHGVPITH